MKAGRKFYMVGYVVRGKFHPVRDPVDGKLIIKKTEKSATKVVTDILKRQGSIYDLVVGLVEIKAVHKRD